jgi:hypothetical protein
MVFGVPGIAHRGLGEEVAKHFQGTAASRLRTARRLGRRALRLFRATLPGGTTLQEARLRLEVGKHRGRRHSAAIEALHR